MEESEPVVPLCSGEEYHQLTISGVKAYLSSGTQGASRGLGAATRCTIKHKVEGLAGGIIVAISSRSGDVRASRAWKGNVVTAVVHASRESVARWSSGATFEHSGINKC